jgi:hypothetical protein
MNPNKRDRTIAPGVDFLKMEEGTHSSFVVQPSLKVGAHGCSGVTWGLPYKSADANGARL